MIVWTANFGRGVDTTHFRADAKHVLDQPGNRDDASVYGIQELDEADQPDEHGVVSTLLDPGTTKVGWGTMEPLLIGGRYKVKRARITHASDGLARWAPTHFWVQALLEDTWQPHLPYVACVNSHSPRRRMTRRDVRAIVNQYDTQRSAVVGFWLAQGFTVIGTEDANTPRPPKSHPRQRTAISSGMDHIWYVQHPAGAQVEVAATGSVHTGIDNHDAHWARLKLTPP